MEEYREVQCVMGQMHLGVRGFREGPRERRDSPAEMQTWQGWRKGDKKGSGHPLGREGQPGRIRNGLLVPVKEMETHSSIPAWEIPEISFSLFL